MKAINLSPGDQFKFGNMRKMRLVTKVVRLPKTSNIPPEHRGKALIIHDGCKQMIVDPDEELSEVVIYNDYLVQVSENNELGNKSGSVSSIQIGEMQLETKFFEGVDFLGFHHSGLTGFKIHEKVFYAKSFIPFFGNITWNAYKLNEFFLLDLINTLAESNDWGCTTAPTEQFRKFNSKEKFNASDIKNLFEDEN